MQVGYQSSHVSLCLGALPKGWCRRVYIYICVCVCEEMTKNDEHGEPMVRENPHYKKMSILSIVTWHQKPQFDAICNKISSNRRPGKPLRSLSTILIVSRIARPSRCPLHVAHPVGCLADLPSYNLHGICKDCRSGITVGLSLPFGNGTKFSSNVYLYRLD